MKLTQIYSIVSAECCLKYDVDTKEYLVKHLVMHQVEDNPSSYVRVPVRVLGCLRGGEITVFLFPGHGLVLTQPIQTHLVPESLRMPYSEFDVLFKHPGAEIVRVLRHDESCPEIESYRIDAQKT